MSSKYYLIAVSFCLSAILFSCTKAVQRDGQDSEKEEMTVPKKPGPITKIPATLSCMSGDRFQFSVSSVLWADTYEWKIADEQTDNIEIIEGQGTNVITVKVADKECVLPPGTVSVTASNSLGTSGKREFLAKITVQGEYEYKVKKYGSKIWMVENCCEAGENGDLGTVPNLLTYTGSGLDETVLGRLNDVKGRYYTWYEAMTGIPGCTPEQCPYVMGYEGVDDAGNPFRLDGTEAGEFGVQIQGCCPEGWHIANANDWWDLLNAVKVEYNVPDDFALGGYKFDGGHDGKPENAVTKESFYKSGCTVKNMGNVGAWLRGGNGRIVDGGVWNQKNLTLTDAGEALLQFPDGASSVGFEWYPLAYINASGELVSSGLGKWGFIWFIGQTDALQARSLTISGTSMNLAMKSTTSEAAKASALHVRCVKNY